MTIPLSPSAPTLTYVGMVRSWASWAKIARCRLSTLAASGWRIGIREVREDRFEATFPLDSALEAMVGDSIAGDVVLTFISPLDYPGLPVDAPRVGQLDYEGSRWPATWVEYADAFLDHVTVPSTFNRDCLVASGLHPDRVDVVPYGFDPAAFTPAGRRPAGSDESLRLLFVGTPARRKGLDILLTALQAAFSPREKVSLRIHIVDYPDLQARVYLDQHWRQRVERLQALGYQIEITTAMMQDEGMADLYRSVDLLCHTFRAESFCIPLVEAMACGTPVLATAWGGPLDFLDASVGYPLHDYDVIPGRDMLLETVGDTALVAEPRAAGVAAQLRHAFDDRDRLAACGLDAARKAGAFSWAASTDRLAGVLRAAVRSPLVRH